MIKHQKVARIISDLFIPPTFTLIGFIYLAINFFDTIFDRTVIIFIAVIFGVLLPIGFFVIYRKRKIVADNDAVIKEQRLYPFITSILLSALGILATFLLTNLNIAVYYWIVITINSIGLLVVNRFWKISAHAIGGATVTGLFYFLDSLLFPYFALLIVLIGWSRFVLKVHTPTQIIAGTLYGFLMTLIQMKIYLGAI